MTGFIVTQGGIPCTLYNAAQNRRGGVLVPGESIVAFAKRRDASRAIKRTKRVANQLQGSLVDDWLKLSPLLTGQPYKIVPLIPSHK